MLDEICYKNNFLQGVIIRIDFAIPLDGIETLLPPEIAKVSMKYFPIAEPKKAISDEVKISQEKVSRTKSEYMEWRFFGLDRKKTLAFLPTAMFVEYSSYTKFETVMEEFIDILTAFYKIYKTAVCTRLGLRYINDIVLDGAPLDWNEYLNPKMLSIFDIYPDKQFISRAFHNLELNFGDFNLRYQFGMHNPDFPAPIKKKSYIMDMDAYYQGPQEYEEISASLEKFHCRIQEIFELSITDKLREVLNG